MNSFFNAVRHLAPLSQEGQVALGGIAKRVEQPKGYRLVKADRVCNYLYFVESGLTRTFYDLDGKDITDWISPENTFACSIVSFITRQPDRRNIELLETSVLYALGFDDLEHLCRTHHEIETLMRRLLASGLVELQHKFDELHFATASQRYAILMERHPDLIRRVPLGMIASYLGITQETLSRTRAQFGI